MLEPLEVQFQIKNQDYKKFIIKLIKLDVKLLRFIVFLFDK
jgi:hypothetical protein